MGSGSIDSNFGFDSLCPLDCFRAEAISSLLFATIVKLIIVEWSLIFETPVRTLEWLFKVQALIQGSNSWYRRSH